VSGKRGNVVCIGEDYLIARAKVKGRGWKAYTPSGKYIGRVMRVFGPVDNPYVKIKIERKWGRRASEIVIRGDKNGRKR
jgi:rRNA processing protein Gar1